MSSKKFVFAVQGEGRGHLTQAIAVYEMLIRHGHTVSLVIVGSSKNRQIPEFFTRKFNIPVVSVASPNFTTDNKSKSIRLGKTVIDNMLKINDYRRSLKIISDAIKEHQPDIIINFYEPLIALYARINKCSARIIAIAHQYIYLHPSFRFPGGNNLQSLAITWYTRLTAHGSDLQLAISMYDIPKAKNKTLEVCPPLLRRQIFTLDSTAEDFILVYLLNSGYAQDIVKYHKKNPDVKLICFTDSKEVREQHHGELKLHENLVFYSLNDYKFLDLMSRCKGLVCTAGFESVCEAMYLDKPVMMVPVKGHYEQYCNARDASRIGAGIYAEEFDISKMEDCFLFYDKKKNESYRAWVNQFEAQFMKSIETFVREAESQRARESESEKQVYKIFKAKVRKALAL
ncbi:MAG TPA: glycosyltransferase family protein [Chitinophagaceae bacterium]|nr:glycosyltransferase family protein [Chitinophagaceae bacterium]